MPDSPDPAAEALGPEALVYQSRLLPDIGVSILRV